MIDEIVEVEVVDIREKDIGKEDKEADHLNLEVIIKEVLHNSMLKIKYM